MPNRLSHHEALIHVMVMMSAVDRSMVDGELERIGQLTRTLPIFETFDQDRLLSTAQNSARLLAAPEGLDILLELVREALAPRLYDTAYALAYEIAAADHAIRPEEIQLLTMLRDRLGLDILVCTAIERGAQARFRR